MITGDAATLWDYRRIDVDVRPYHQLTRHNAKRAAFDGRVVWASSGVVRLWNDRSDRGFWAKFAKNVEIVQISSIQHDWSAAL